MKLKLNIEWTVNKDSKDSQKLQSLIASQEDECNCRVFLIGREKRGELELIHGGTISKENDT